MNSTTSQQQNNASSAPDLLSGSNADLTQSTNEPSQTTNYVSMEMASELPLHQGGVHNDDDENQSVAESIVSSVLTADGIHDFPGFLCVCLVILLGDMSRGVMFPSMWPLVESLGGTQVTLGYSVAAFSFGRVLVNPLFGSMSHTLGYSKTLFIATSILLLGTLMYAQVQNVGNPQFLIVAQTCLGIGSGTLGVTRAFVADVTAKRNRTTYMGWITAVQYGGFTVTPFVGSFFIVVLKDSDVSLGPIRFNMYTAPAYFMTVIAIIALFVLAVFFRDRQRISLEKETRKSTKQAEREDYANSMTFVGLSVFDCCVLGCFLLNVSTKGSIASFETMGIAIAQSHFDMTSSRAGLIVSFCGAVGVYALLSLGLLGQYFSDVQLIGGGMAIMCLGIAALVPIKENFKNPGWEYFLAIFLIYGIGYPVGHTAVIGIFSKIVGRRPQGYLLGWFASAGSLARMFFPVMSGYISSYAGVDKLFIVLCCVLVLSIFFVYLSRNTLNFLSC
ncbi:hypothetical protein ACA910_003322 [Epithemia clementina (nom. ined.)]